MEFTFGSGYLSGQGDLIDFGSDTSIEAYNERPTHSAGVEPPVMKSKNRGRINSDVVAIKSGTGDIAFVAVGRPSMNQNPPVKQKHRKTRSNGEKQNLQAESFSRSNDRPSEGGIDNLGYSTVSRNESYTYDDTGFNYYSHLERWSNSEFLNLDQSPIHQPAYVSVIRGPEYQENDSSTEIAGTSQQRFVSDATRSQRSTPDPESNQGQAPSPETSTPTEQSSEPVIISDSEGTDSRELSELDAVDKTSPKRASPLPKLPPLCKSCGQNHGVTENHEYNYVDEVDEDMMCDICLQPLVDPYDTKCGHTFCCICIKNYLRVKHICPVDRVDLTNSNTDCWQSSLILRKLVNKLAVTCPNEKYCKTTLQRSDLKDHLKENCPGAVIKCPKSMYGCAHKSPRVKMKRHIDICPFKDHNDKLSDLHPFSEDVTIELFRPEGTAELGILIVGGSDTPLHYIVIQSILKESLAGLDGRLQIGDIIVEINGEPMFSVTHAEARAALTKPSNLMRFTLLRDAAVEENSEAQTSLARSSSSVTHNDECVCLIKPPLEQLGIRISSSETGAKGVYIIELIQGQVAQTDGRLQVGDRILKIGNSDLSDSTPERAARVISSCDREVKIHVRHMAENTTIVCNNWVEDTMLSKLKTRPCPTTLPKLVGALTTPSTALKSSSTRKLISVTKSPKENLGIIVSGGNGSPRGNLPIFVQDVLPMSVLGKDKRIKRGDLLSEINSIRLNGLSHTQAMNVLRESAQQREVTLLAYELDYEGKAEDTALWDELTSLHQNPSKWAPSWKMWLAATREFSSIREVTLRKSNSNTYGFKITGGFSEESGPSPIFITHVSKNSTACKHLKCGDEIIAINKRPVKDIQHAHVLSLIRTAPCIYLKIVSWPGSVH